MHVGIANPRWRGKRSRHSRRMHNPQFYVSGKRPMAVYHQVIIYEWFFVDKFSMCIQKFADLDTSTWASEQLRHSGAFSLQQTKFLVVVSGYLSESTFMSASAPTHVYIMHMWCHGKDFRFLIPFLFYLLLARKAVEHTAKWSVIWDTMTLLGRHC